MTVQLIKRADDWKATIGNGIWEAGRTPSAAYQKLKITEPTIANSPIAVDIYGDVTVVNAIDVWTLDERFAR